MDELAEPTINFHDDVSDSPLAAWEQTHHHLSQAMKRNTWFNRLLCLMNGHCVVPTGRHAIVLREWHCQRCDRFYVSHHDYGDMLLPADQDSDRLFSDVERISSGLSGPVAQPKTNAPANRAGATN